MNILVTGGTGGLGRLFVRSALTAGHKVRVMSRRPRPDSASPTFEWSQADVVTGVGLAEAVADVDTILHCASSPREEAVDVTGTENLVNAAKSAQIRHLIYISIVGIDVIPLGYYQRKCAAERIVESDDMPFSILRTTQFHSLVNSMIAAAARFPFVVPLPTDFKFQSVAAAEVADRLVVCLKEGPKGRLADFGGPETLSLGEMAKTWMEVRQARKRLVRLPIPGTIAAGFRAGRNTTSEGFRGKITWRDWLLQRKQDASARRS